MKKKCGVALMIVMMLSLLITTLIACKSEQSKSVVQTNDALVEVMSAWIKGNGYQYSGTLGWDFNTRITSDNSDITFSFKGGIKEKEENVNKMQLSMFDNISKTAIMEITADEKALYLNLGEGAQYEITDVDIKSQSITGESASSAVDLVEMLVPVVVGMFAPEETEVTITENEKTYDKRFHMTFDIPSTISTLVDLVGGLVGLDDNAVNNVIEQLTTSLEGAIFEMDLITTGNMKVEIPKEDRDDFSGKYVYEGGIFAPAGIVIKTGNSDVEYNIVIGGINLINSIPNIVSPDGYVKTKLLQFELDGTFDLKKGDGSNIADYEYNLQVMLDTPTVFKSIVQVIKTKSISPLIKGIFNNNEGRIVFDVYHKHNKSCGLEHLDENFDGSIITVAYDPSDEAFNNARVHVALHPRAILTKGVFSALGIEGLAPILNTIIPKDYISYAVSPIDNIKIKEAQEKRLINLQSKMSENVDIGALIAEIIDVVANAEMSGGGASIDFSSVRAIAVKYYGEQSPVVKLIDALFPEVQTLEIKAAFQYGAEYHNNGKQAFMKANRSDAIKTFTAPNGKNIAILEGDISPSLDKQGNIDLSGSGIDYYNEDGTYKPLSAVEFKSIIGKEFVKASWIDINGVSQSSMFKVVAIAGLNENKFGEEQVITLGLSYATNPDYTLKSLMIAIDKLLPNTGINIDTMDYVVNTRITLTEQIGDIRFTQDGLSIDGDVISNDKKFNADKVYAYGEIAPELRYNAIVEYQGGKAKRYLTNPLNDIAIKGKITSAKSVTIRYSIFSNEQTIDFKMNDELAQSKAEVSLVAGGQFVLQNPVAHIGLGHELAVPRVKSKEFFDSMVKAYPEAGITQDSSIFDYKGMTITFPIAGKYSGVLSFENGASILYAFIVK